MHCTITYTAGVWDMKVGGKTPLLLGPCTGHPGNGTRTSSVCPGFCSPAVLLPGTDASVIVCPLDMMSLELIMLFYLTSGRIGGGFGRVILRHMSR